jgi:hypothetical protein
VEAGEVQMNVGDTVIADNVFLPLELFTLRKDPAIYLQKTAGRTVENLESFPEMIRDCRFVDFEHVGDSITVKRSMVNPAATVFIEKASLNGEPSEMYSGVQYKLEVGDKLIVKTPWNSDFVFTAKSQMKEVDINMSSTLARE